MRSSSWDISLENGHLGCLHSRLQHWIYSDLSRWRMWLGGRRSFKCWVIAYVCMSSRAVSLLPCPGYSMAIFLTTHHHFTGMYVKPSSDHTPSLIRAAESYDWAEIGYALSSSGTEWRLTAKGCSWRNGLVERVIRSAHHTLAGELQKGCLLDFHQFGSVLVTAAAILNSQPLSLRHSPEGDFLSIAPRDVLLGRANRSRKGLETELGTAMELEDDLRLDQLEEAQSRIISKWREKSSMTWCPGQSGLRQSKICV